MQITGRALRVRIYIGESDRYGREPLMIAILQRLKEEGAAGATVVRGVAGFGANSRIHTASIVRLSEDLPIVIEWVDRAERVHRILPIIDEMVHDGLITVEEVEVHKYAHRALRRPPDDILVSDVMSREVGTVSPSTPVAEIVQRLVDASFRAVPVVDEEGHVVGIITDGDLLQRAGVPRAAQQWALTPEMFRSLMMELAGKGQRAADIMTSPVITVHSSQTLADAMRVMASHQLKRLPVVDHEGRLCGIISRIDALRAVGQRPAAEDAGPGAIAKGRTVADIMQQDVPTVRPDTPLPEVVDALLTARQRRAIVIDAQRRVLGIITDGDLIARAREEEKPRLLERLHRTPAEPPSTWRWDTTKSRASDVMTPHPICVPATATPEEALALILRNGIKRLPVVDDEGRLVGLVGRAGLLRALLSST